MRAPPLGVFRVLCRRRNINSACNSFKSTVKVANNVSIFPTISLIRKYPSPIPWEQVIKELADQDEDAQTVILKTCTQLKNADIVMSFCRYVIDKGENLNEVNLFMLVHALSSCPTSKVLQDEEFLMHIYNMSKGLMTSKLFQNFAVNLFSHIPQCYREFLQMSRNYESFFKREPIICRAFDFDDATVAWELLEEGNYILIDEITKSFVNYCIRQALQNKFSIDLIDRYVILCQRKSFIILSEDILCTFQPLVHVLTHCQDKYIWSVKKCIINPQVECLSCNTTLNDGNISQEEFNALKKAVFETLLPSKNVFLKTSFTEWTNFKYFLRKCEPFDMVIDGLNYIYRGIVASKKKIVARILENYIMQQNIKVLIISRKHYRKEFFKKLKNIQIFYTENSSDDDLFLLCAAMHGGLGTKILTSDFLCTHAAKLSYDMKLLFIKWQHYHQYVIDTRSGIVPPSRHLGLPQRTYSQGREVDSYKWHLSYQENDLTPYSFRLKFDWICLQAVPRIERPAKQINC